MAGRTRLISKGTDMAVRTQKNRAIAINSPLGEDVLLLRAFTLKEELGRPFSIQADIRSETADIDFDKIVGENVTIRLNRADGKARYLNGYVARFAQSGMPQKDGSNEYAATIVPWLWFLTRTQDCRIFQEMTIPEIVQKVFKDFGFTDFELALTGKYEKREYVVQYRETAFNFVSRLLEHAGIYYFFEHENGKHTMVLADSPAAHEPAEAYESIRYHGNEKSKLGFERVWEWSVERRIQPGAFVLTDFDFKAPAKALLAEALRTAKHAAAEFSIFDYPGTYAQVDHGKAYAAVRAEELASQHEIVRAEGDVRGVHAGCKFTLGGMPRTDQNREYVIIRQEITARVDDFTSGKAGQAEEFFEGSFAAVAAKTQIRPARTSPKPAVAGPQTAIVCGTSGEEIYTDEWGRVKVKFHWDRYSAGDEKSSCWIRVAQSWAGKKWGSIFTPRVGQEVIVDFLEGDPDQPIITGRVYNNENMPPYALPANKTMSTTKTNSSKGGAGFNEIRFEDKAGEEQLFIHAQKNMDIRVLADCFETIKNDRGLIVEHDQMELVKNDRSEKVEGHHKEHVVKDFNLLVEGKQAIEVTGLLSETIGGDVVEVYKGEQSTSVAKQLSIKADIIALEAATNITLKVGESYIAIDSSSINIKTTNLTIETDANTKITATANFEAKGTAQAKVEGGMVSVKADGVGSVEAGGPLTVKGATTAVG